MRSSRMRYVIEAADAAVRAHRIDLAVDRLRAEHRLRHQRAGRAGLHALAAADAARCAHRIVEVEHDRRLRAAPGVADDVVDLHLAAGAHAARALDAGGKVDRHGRVRQVGCRRLASQRRQRRPHDDAQACGPGRELAVRLQAGVVVPLVAGCGQVGQQQLQHQAPAGAGSLAVGAHRHAGRRGAAATGGQRAFAGDLDHAGAAVAVRAQSLLGGTGAGSRCRAGTPRRGSFRRDPRRSIGRRA